MGGNMVTPLRLRSLLVLLSAMLAALLSTSPAQAARFVEFRIYLNGQFILLASRGDEGEPDKDVVWDYLKDQPLRTPDATDLARDRRDGPRKGAPKPEPFVVKADADNPLQATLKGKIKVYCRYSYTREVSTLWLVRKSEKDSVWRVAPDEVKRMREVEANSPPPDAGAMTPGGR
jgi:hypothetical protein